MEDYFAFFKDYPKNKNIDLIRTEEIAKDFANSYHIDYTKAKKTTNVYLKRLADNGKIKRINRGVYVVKESSIFGEYFPQKNNVILDGFLFDGDRIGYISGEEFRRSLGLVDWISNTMEVTSNHWRRSFGNLKNVKSKKPVTEITEENWKYLRFLDMIKDMTGHIYINSPNPDIILDHHINKEELDKLILLRYAKQYYPRKVLDKIVDLITR